MPVTKRKRPPPRPDEDYQALDDAMCGLQKFSHEIRWMLCQMAINSRAFDDVAAAMERLHDGELESSPR